MIDLIEARNKFREVCAAAPGFAQYFRGKIDAGKVRYFNVFPGNEDDGRGCFWNHVGVFLFPKKVKASLFNPKLIYTTGAMLAAKEKFLGNAYDYKNALEKMILLLPLPKALAMLRTWCDEWVAEQVPTPAPNHLRRRLETVLRLARFWRHEAGSWRSRYEKLRKEMTVDLRPDAIPQYLRDLEDP